MTTQLPRFNNRTALIDFSGVPSFAFHVWWDKVASTIEANITTLNTQLADIQAAQADIIAAQADIIAAQSAADDAASAAALAQAAADNAQAAADSAAADATSALAQLTDIASDNVLTPVEKMIVISDYNVITGEQTDIDSKATTYGITTEKTNYDNAISTLTTYLSGLTSPVAWNNTSGNTSITGTTFRSNFEDVYTKRQLLLNAIDAAAKVLADAAQSTANTANTTATSANTAATTAQSTANEAVVNDSISTSWTSPGSILTAIDTGSNARITVATHTRKYSDATSKSFTGANVNSLNYSTTYYVYCDDPNRTGGATTYHATTNPNTALSGAVNGRHYCGKITTPAAGGGGTSGGYSPPSGGGGIGNTDVP